MPKKRNKTKRRTPSESSSSDEESSKKISKLDPAMDVINKLARQIVRLQEKEKAKKKEKKAKKEKTLSVTEKVLAVIRRHTPPRTWPPSPPPMSPKSNTTPQLCTDGSENPSMNLSFIQIPEQQPNIQNDEQETNSTNNAPFPTSADVIPQTCNLDSDFSGQAELFQILNNEQETNYTNNAPCPTTANATPQPCNLDFDLFQILDQQSSQNNENEQGQNSPYRNDSNLSIPMLEELNLDDCAICLESMEEGYYITTVCNHKIHNTCYNDLLQHENNPRCPNCRTWLAQEAPSTTVEGVEILSENITTRQPPCNNLYQAIEELNSTQSRLMNNQNRMFDGLETLMDNQSNLMSTQSETMRRQDIVVQRQNTLREEIIALSPQRQGSSTQSSENIQLQIESEDYLDITTDDEEEVILASELSKQAYNLSKAKSNTNNRNDNVVNTAEPSNRNLVNDDPPTAGPSNSNPQNLDAEIPPAESNQRSVQRKQEFSRETIHKYRLFHYKVYKNSYNPKYKIKLDPKQNLLENLASHVRINANIHKTIKQPYACTFFNFETCKNQPNRIGNVNGCKKYKGKNGKNEHYGHYCLFCFEKFYQFADHPYYRCPLKKIFDEAEKSFEDIKKK